MQDVVVSWMISFLTSSTIPFSAAFGRSRDIGMLSRRPRRPNLRTWNSRRYWTGTCLTVQWYIPARSPHEFLRLQFFAASSNPGCAVASDAYAKDQRFAIPSTGRVCSRQLRRALIKHHLVIYPTRPRLSARRRRSTQCPPSQPRLRRV